jgi:hypothetical protein
MDDNDTLEANTSQFFFEFPLWFIAFSTSGLQSRNVCVGDPDIGFLTAGNEGEQFVALFTDEDLANRAARAVPVPGPMVVKLDTPAEGVNFLEVVMKRGVNWVIFDGHAGSPCRSQRSPILEVIEILKGAS